MHAEFPVRSERAKGIAKVMEVALGMCEDVDYATDYPLPVCFSGYLVLCMHMGLCITVWV